MVPAISWVQTFETDHPNTFALTVVGESMQPEFTKGDIIFVDPGLEPASGDYVIAKNGEDATFKQLIRERRERIAQAGERPLPDQGRYGPTGENSRRRCWQAEAVSMRVCPLTHRGIVAGSWRREGWSFMLKLQITLFLATASPRIAVLTLFGLVPSPCAGIRHFTNRLVASSAGERRDCSSKFLL